MVPNVVSGVVQKVCADLEKRAAGFTTTNTLFTGSGGYGQSNAADELNGYASSLTNALARLPLEQWLRQYVESDEEGYPDIEKLRCVYMEEEGVVQEMLEAAVIAKSPEKRVMLVNEEVIGMVWETIKEGEWVDKLSCASVNPRYRRPGITDETRELWKRMLKDDAVFYDAFAGNIIPVSAMAAQLIMAYPMPDDVYPVTDTDWRWVSDGYAARRNVWKLGRRGTGMVVAEAQSRMDGKFAYLPLGSSEMDKDVMGKLAEKIVAADKKRLPQIVDGLSVTELQWLPELCASNNAVNLRLREVANRIVRVDAHLPQAEHNRELNALKGHTFDSSLNQKLCEIVGAYTGDTSSVVVVTCVRERMLGGITIMAAEKPRNVQSDDADSKKSEDSGIIERIVFPEKTLVIKPGGTDNAAGGGRVVDGLVGELVGYADNYLRQDAKKAVDKFGEMTEEWASGKENVCTRLLLQVFSNRPVEKKRERDESFYWRYNSL
jgi:hypothetical protein